MGSRTQSSKCVDIYPQKFEKSPRAVNSVLCSGVLLNG